VVLRRVYVLFARPKELGLYGQLCSVLEYRTHFRFILLVQVIQDQSPWPGQIQLQNVHFYRNSSGSLYLGVYRSFIAHALTIQIQKTTIGLTLSSTRTPPALSSALSLHSASSASFIASVQAWPVSILR
jgi:hypothetical protein